MKNLKCLRCGTESGPLHETKRGIGNNTMTPTSEVNQFMTFHKIMHGPLFSVLRQIVEIPIKPDNKNESIK